MYGDTFERLFGLGRDALLSGTHQCETHPVDGGSRYGLSVVLRPDPSAAARLATVGAEAAEFTGAGHWPSGDADLVHFTVRSLERHRESVPPDDPAAERYRTALEKAAGRPIRLRLAGLTLTPVSVMACAWPCDDAADQFAAALAAALGEDGAYENGERDVWYANVLHFAGPVADPAGPGGMGDPAAHARSRRDHDRHRRTLPMGARPAPTGAASARHRPLTRRRGPSRGGTPSTLGSAPDHRQPRPSVTERGQAVRSCQ